MGAGLHVGDLVGDLLVAEETDTESLAVGVGVSSGIVATSVVFTLEVVFVDLVVVGLVILGSYFLSFGIGHRESVGLGEVLGVAHTRVGLLVLTVQVALVDTLFDGRPFGVGGRKGGRGILEVICIGVVLALLNSRHLGARHFQLVGLGGSVPF